MEWSNDTVLLLLQQDEKLPILWNVKHPEYYSKTKKNDAWQELVNKLNIETLLSIYSGEAQKKIKSLMGSFRREKSKIKASMGTGKGAKDVYKSKWFAFEPMQFLLNRDEPRRGLNTETEDVISNTEDDANDTEDEPQESTEEESVSTYDTPSVSTFSNRNSPLQLPIHQRKKKIAEDPRIEEAFQILKKRTTEETQNPYSAYAQHIAQKMLGYSNQTRIFVEHSINNILFEADIGRLERSSATSSSLNRGASHSTAFTYNTPMPMSSNNSSNTCLPRQSPSTSTTTSYYHNFTSSIIPNSNIPLSLSTASTPKTSPLNDPLTSNDSNTSNTLSTQSGTNANIAQYFQQFS